MSEIYYALIIFPILFMIAMGYIYSSALSDIQVQLIRINCPYPILNYNITALNLNGATITYNQTFDSDPVTLHVFRCGENNEQSVNVAEYIFSNNWFGTGEQTFWTAVQSNMAAWSSTMSTFFDKVIALGTLIQLFINAPALVLNIPAYIYVNIVLFVFIGLGGFMVIRG